MTMQRACQVRVPFCQRQLVAENEEWQLMCTYPRLRLSFRTSVVTMFVVDASAIENWPDTLEVAGLYPSANFHVSRMQTS